MTPRTRGAFRASGVGIVLLVYVLVMWSLDHFARLNFWAALATALATGFIAGGVFIMSFLSVLRRRSVKVETRLDLIEVPTWRFVLWSWTLLVPKRNGVQSLAMLPSGDDLPGREWKMVRQYTSRVRATSDAGRRARAAGCVMGVRIFARDDPKLRWTFWLIPTANEDDAQVMVTKPRHEAPVATTVIADANERELVDVVVPGIHPIWAFELEYTTKSQEGRTRMLRGSLGTVVFELQSSGSPEAASWEEIIRMADVFVERVRSTQPPVGQLARRRLSGRRGPVSPSAPYP